MEGNTQIRLGALDQLKDKQYDITADPKDFKQECERLFAVAHIDNEGEMLRYLHDMLPDRLYAVMVGANPQTSNAFYEVLERYWRRHKIIKIKASDEPVEQATSEASTIQMLLQALSAKTPTPKPEPIQEKSPLCKNCGRTGHWAATCRQSGRSQEQCNWCGRRGHQEQNCRTKQQSSRNNPPVQRNNYNNYNNFNNSNRQGNQQRPQPDTRRCFNCGKQGHVQAQCFKPRHDTNALGEDLQEPPTIKDLFQDLYQAPELSAPWEEEEEKPRRKFQHLTPVGTFSSPTAVHTYLNIGGVKYKTLIDTGASISIMSAKVLQNIGQQVQQVDTVSAMTADQTMIDTIGLVHDVKVQLEDLIVPSTFRVIKKPAIL